MRIDRKIEEFYAVGDVSRDPALVTAILYENGRITATADEDKVTEFRLLQQLGKQYPTHEFKIAAVCGRSGHDAYYIVDGMPKPIPRPEADEGSAAVNSEVKRNYPDYGGRYG